MTQLIPPHEASSPLKERFEFALSAMFNWQPFTGHIYAGCKVIETRAVGTAFTNCADLIGYNPDYMSRFGSEAIHTILAHEVRHIVLQHVPRLEGRDPSIWNMAADYVINKQLAQEKYDFSSWDHVSVAAMCRSLETGAPPPAGPRGEGICFDLSLDDNISTEDLYDKLMAAKAKNPGQGPGGDEDGPGEAGGAPGGPGGEGSEPGSSAAGGKMPMSGDLAYREFERACAEAKVSVEQMRNEINARILAAAELAKSMGRLPGSIDRLVTGMRQPSVDWRSVLRAFIRNAYGPGVIGGVYSFQRPNRRNMDARIALPALRKIPAPPMVLVIDTSGSITQELLDVFASEMRGILRDVKPSLLTVLYVDAAVQHVDKFRPDDMLVLNARGGGGTDMPVAYEWIKENKVKPACVVFLTDMYTPFGEKPPYPVLWGAITDVVAPYGKTVKVKL